MRRGLTLIELLVALAAFGLLAAIAVPTIGRLADRLAVGDAALHLASAHSRARITALTRGSLAVLRISADTLALDAVRSGDTTRVWWEPGPAASRVALSGPSRTVVFTPTGLTYGLANATYRLRRGAVEQSVVVSRLGRVRIVR